MPLYCLRGWPDFAFLAISKALFVDIVEESLEEIFVKLYIDNLRTSLLGNGQFSLGSESLCASSFVGLAVADIFSKARSCWKQLLSGVAGRVPVAVSGGKDSMALIVAMQTIGLPVLGLVVNHRLRSTSDEETELVVRNLRSYGIDVELFIWEHGEIATGMEERARNARYSLLTQFCLSNGLQYLLVGHHLNDQVETVLMNLARGSGLEGMCGMKPVSVCNGVSVVRPMLGIARDKIECFVVDKCIPFVEDPSNSDLSIVRNRLRENLLDVTNGPDVLDYRIAGTAKLLQQERVVKQLCLKMLDGSLLPSSLGSGFVCSATSTNGDYSISSLDYVLLGDALMFHFLSSRIAVLTDGAVEGDSVRILMDNVSKKRSGSQSIGGVTVSWSNCGVSVRSAG